MVVDLAAGALRLLPAEAAHRSTVALLRSAASLIVSAPQDDPRLSTRVLGLSFHNPIGLAAGFDKDADVPDAMLKLGFGFVECGTVTPKPQPGNPRPRLFRLKEDGAVINRMGFNNDGMEAAAQRLQRRRECGGVVGINIGANKDSADRIADYRQALARLVPLADYVAVNVSSPNTPGLRNLQQRDELERLLAAIMGERSRVAPDKPVLLKIAPDLDAAAIDEIADVALAAEIQGIIATNTTTERPSSLRSLHAKEQGGLSGAPLFSRSTEVLRQLYRRAGGKIVLVGVGGVSSGADAYAKIRAGASLVQLYTALALQGPGLIPRIKRELLGLIARDCFACVSDAIGADAAAG